MRRSSGPASFPQDFEQLLLQSAIQISGAKNLVIDDTPGIGMTELRSKCRKKKLESGLDLVIIDYLQLMSGSGKGGDNRQQEIAEISRNLKSLAREMEAPVIALSQLSRACEAETGPPAHAFGLKRVRCHRAGCGHRHVPLQG
jgi:replicative DNA helicase